MSTHYHLGAEVWVGTEDRRSENTGYPEESVPEEEEREELSVEELRDWFLRRSLPSTPKNRGKLLS